MSASGDRAEDMVDEEALLMVEAPITKEQVVTIVNTELRRLLSEQLPLIVRSVMETRDLVMTESAAEGFDEDDSYEDVAPAGNSFNDSSHSNQFVAPYHSNVPPQQQNHAVQHYPNQHNSMAAAQQPMVGIPMAGQAMVPMQHVGMVSQQNQWGNMNGHLPAKRKKVSQFLFCFFCKATRSHKAKDCGTVISRSIRRNILMSLNRCLKCTKSFKDHDPNACAALRCGTCGLRTHPSALCPRNTNLSD